MKNCGSKAKVERCEFMLFQVKVCQVCYPGIKTADLVSTLSFAASLVQFYTLIKHIANFDPLYLASYGCYCGLGNTGTEKVVDCLDM